MVISQLDKIVILIAVLVAVGVLLPLVWISSLKGVTTAMEDVRITDVQFEEDYLNITVENLDTQEKIVSQVTVRDLKANGYGFTVDWTSTPHVVAVHEPVPVSEEISFRIRFRCTSGYAYQIELKTTDKGWGTSFNVIVP